MKACGYGRVKQSMVTLGSWIHSIGEGRLGVTSCFNVVMVLCAKLCGYGQVRQSTFTLGRQEEGEGEGRLGATEDFFNVVLMLFMKA